MVLFAISITALLTVGALVMGGSNGYSAVRNSQTAADAASLAATKTMREIWQGSVPVFDDAGDPTSAVLDTAIRVAEDNGADTGSVSCEIVRAGYAESYDDAQVLGDCDGTWENAMSADGLPVAGGVRVRVEETRDVPFGGVIGEETIRASAVATATVQPIRGGFKAPFMLCSFGDDHGVDLLLPAPALDPPYRVNPGALNVEFLLWANGNGMGSRNCDISAWHGLVNSDHTYQVPSDPDEDEGWWDIDTGSRVGHIPRILAGTDVCDWNGEIEDNSADCRMALPLCVGSVGSGTNVRFNCVRMATFEITYVGDGDAPGSCASVNKKVVCGRLLDDTGSASGGQGTMDPVDPFELAAIKLVE